MSSSKRIFQCPFYVSNNLDQAKGRCTIRCRCPELHDHTRLIMTMDSFLTVTAKWCASKNGWRDCERAHRREVALKYFEEAKNSNGSKQS